MNDNASSAGRSISLRGALAVSTAGGLLVVYAKFGFEWPVWNPLTRVAYFAGVLALCLWGIEQIIREGSPATSALRRRSRQRILLPPQGLAYLLIMMVMFVGSLLGRSNLLMLMFSLMAGPFILNGWVMVMMLRRTRVFRAPPESVIAGEALPVELTIENRKRWLSSWLMEVRDCVSRGDETLSVGVLFARVPPRARRTESYRLRLLRRGRYTLGPLTLSTRFPLGLVERCLTFDAPGELVVYPRLGRLTARWNRERLQAAELARRQEPQRGTFDDEFYHLREHRWGDNPRSIHWRTSARQSQLMVREFHESREPDLVLLLDLWLPPRADDADRERIEQAVSFAATACVEQIRRAADTRIELRIDGETFASWSGRRGPAAVPSLLRELALAEGSPVTDPRRLIESGEEVRSPRARVLLITTRPKDEVLAQALAGAGRGQPPRVLEAGSAEFRSFFWIDPLDQAPATVERWVASN